MNISRIYKLIAIISVLLIMIMLGVYFYFNNTRNISLDNPQDNVMINEDLEERRLRVEAIKAKMNQKVEVTEEDIAERELQLQRIRNLQKNN